MNTKKKVFKIFEENLKNIPSFEIQSSGFEYGEEKKRIRNHGKMESLSFCAFLRPFILHILSKIGNIPFIRAHRQFLLQWIHWKRMDEDMQVE